MSPESTTKIVGMPPGLVARVDRVDWVAPVDCCVPPPRSPRSLRRYEVHHNHTALFQTSSRPIKIVQKLESWRVKSESRNPLTLQLFNFSTLQLLSFQRPVDLIPWGRHEWQGPPIPQQHPVTVRHQTYFRCRYPGIR